MGEQLVDAGLYCGIVGAEFCLASGVDAEVTMDHLGVLAAA